MGNELGQPPIQTHRLGIKLEHHNSATFVVVVVVALQVVPHHWGQADFE
jgi:hypothetical protein